MRLLQAQDKPIFRLYNSCMARVLVIIVIIILAGIVYADEIVIGTRVSPSSLDPHLGGLGSDQGYYQHIYDALFVNDEHLQPQPALATSVEIINELVWEMTLRENVKFHDGTEFDSKDVLFTFARLGTVPGSDGLQEEKLRPVERIEALDKHRIRFITKSPTPYLLRRLIDFWILSDSIDPDTTTEEINRGKAIGTGSFELVKWKRGNELILKRFENYWGEKPDFARVRIKEMTNDATRVAALQAGDVDMIDYVPPLDTYRLKRMSNINVFVTKSARVIFIQLDTLNRISHQIINNEGQRLDHNPLQDNRVRQALKLAVSKELIVNKIMEGLAYPANQAVPEGYEGFDPDIPPGNYDPDKAKSVLTEAGYPNGFGITLSCPNDRYINDAIICQAVGQMWTQVGIKTKIETMPKSVYFSKMLAGEFSAYMLGWGNTRGDSISVLKNVIHSRGKAGGTWNSSYSNPILDQAIDEAMSIMDQFSRERILRSIMSKAMIDNALLPLHSQPVIVATRRDLHYTPLPSEETLAIQLRKTH